LEDSDRTKYLFLSLLQAKVGSSLVSRLGNLAPEAVLETPFVELSEQTRTSEKASRAFDELQRGFDPDAIEDSLAAKGIQAVTLVDDGYPGSLRGIPDPPPALFVDGNVPETVTVALVGSRKASATGIETARALGLALSERGVCVVSGLALGVDAAAHEGLSRPEGRRLVCSGVASTLPILQNTNRFELGFRTLLSEGRESRLELTRA
jgi:DNA processing protein